ncbi:MAG: hypothetical protein DCC58_09090 [Chloroflexi bacterium]|nr:MAG: hypothetical protein DCC58_09090 [Chloroflexota bacterium]
MQSGISTWRLPTKLWRVPPPLPATTPPPPGTLPWASRPLLGSQRRRTAGTFWTTWRAFPAPANRPQRRAVYTRARTPLANSRTQCVIPGRRVMPSHTLYPSLEALLQPATLAALTGSPVEAVTVEPFKTIDSLSGSRFLRVLLDGDPARAHVVKRIAHDRDWLMRATGDRIGRSALAWETGLYDDTPPEIDAVVVACSNDDAGGGRALLMRDIAPHLVPAGDAPISVAENDIFLGAMAALHATFWNQSARAAAELGFITPEQVYHAFSPETGRREAEGEDAIPKAIAAGWELLPELVGADVRSIVEPLLEDPRPLTTALAPYRVTVVHSDWKLGNLGIIRHTGAPPQVVLLDWDRVCAGQPGLDLGWYLAVNSARLPVSKEAVITGYRAHLEARLAQPLDDAWWQAQLELSLLGAFLQLGWPKLLGAASPDPSTAARERAELDWWTSWVLAGAARL